MPVPTLAAAGPTIANARACHSREVRRDFMSISVLSRILYVV
jgi:hypothetical protein